MKKAEKNSQYRFINQDLQKISQRNKRRKTEMYAKLLFTKMGSP